VNRVKKKIETQNLETVHNNVNGRAVFSEDSCHNFRGHAEGYHDAGNKHYAKKHTQNCEALGLFFFTLSDLISN
jgi:hypothetical protein